MGAAGKVPRLERNKPVVIIGGGVIGVCCAYALARAGVPVVLLERGEICSGCSYGNAGLLAASHSIPLAAPGVVAKALRWMFEPESAFALPLRADAQLLRWLWRFYWASRPSNLLPATTALTQLTLGSARLHAEFAAAHGAEYGYTQKGSLEMFATAEGLAEAQSSVKLLRRVGLQVEVLGPQETKALEPEAAPGIAGGVFFRQDGHIVPAKFVRAVAAAAAKAGAVLCENSEVVEVRTTAGHIGGVRTRESFHEAASVILAAGAASPLLAQALGIDLPVQSGRGYSFTMQRADNWPQRTLMFGEAKGLLTPMGETLRLAGTLELVPPGAPPNPRRTRAIARKLGAYLTRPVSIEGVEPWSGDRPCSPDGLPIIGWSERYANLLYATGHAMLGMTLGPITGQIAAQLIRKEQPGVDITRLRPGRFGAAL